jgi:hypothetical protein
MTPLLTTTSAHPFSTGISSRRPSRNSSFLSPMISAVLRDFFKHLWEHVYADDLTLRTNLMCRDKAVKTPARSGIYHPFTLFE